MNVLFRYKNGSQRTMKESYAILLQRLGHGSYTTESSSPAKSEPAKIVEQIPLTDSASTESDPQDSVNESGDQEGVRDSADEAAQHDIASTQAVVDLTVPVTDLEQLTRPQLLALADAMQLKVHGNSSDDKIRELIAQAQS